ncbi:MAG: hypothetical protein Q8R37_00660 [Nanoarchaeota archaeon]|nr:hypothetical protein [Nanoarchaeota archaeon]
MQKVETIFCLATIYGDTGLGLFNIRRKTDTDLERTIKELQLPEGYTPSAYAEFYAVSAITEGNVSKIESEAEYTPGLFIVLAGESPTLGKAVVSQYFGKNKTYERTILARGMTQEAGTYEERDGIKFPTIDKDVHNLPKHYQHKDQVDAVMKLLVTGRSI